MKPFLLCLALTLTLPLTAYSRSSVGVVVDNNICQWGPPEGPCYVGPKGYDVMKSAGIRWVRYVLYWNLANPFPDVYDFKTADYEISEMQKRGAIVWISIYGAPEHANQGSAAHIPMNCVDANMPRNRELCDNAPPLDREAWVKFVRKTAEHFRGRVHYYGFWNEPNYPMFWPREDQQELIDTLLVPGYDTLKAVNPWAQVVGPETDDIGNLRLHLQREKNSGRRYFDIISYHAYAWSDDYYQAAVRARQFQSVAEQFAEGRRIWITEAAPICNHSVQLKAEKFTMFLDWISDLNVDVVFMYRLETTDAGNLALVDIEGKPTGAEKVIGDYLRLRVPRRRPVLRIKDESIGIVGVNEGLATDDYTSAPSRVPHQ
jgi:hypothetical protein